jgi:UV DNA damage endonuclease
MNKNYGYACINETLKKEGVTTNRSLKKATLDKKGLDYCSELAVQNIRDLEKYLHWNLENDILVFRMSSNMIPWGNKVDWFSFKDFSEIKDVLVRCGEFAAKHGMRLTMHPGQYCILTSPHQHVIDNSVSDLQMHSDLMDLMGLSRTHYNKINIHMGATYGDKESAIKTFLKNFNKLPDAIKSRLTIENDDKGNMYSTKELFEGIHKNANIPIVFDYHHHRFCTGGQSEEEALRLAVSTWGNIKPIVHYSESKALNESLKVKMQAHSDYFLNEINTYGMDMDIMMEVKMKELALLKYRNDFDKSGR